MSSLNNRRNALRLHDGTRAVTGRRAFWLWGALLCSLTTTVSRAEVQVEGSFAAVRITTNQAKISDVLAAVTKTFNVKSRIAIPLETAANASYAGSFGHVMSRLLDGYDYMIKRDQGAIEIVVLEKHGTLPIAPPPLSRRARGVP
jgi:hypothetical protein